MYFGSRDAHVYVLDAKTGTRKWLFATVGGAWASSSPAVAEGVVDFGEGFSGLYRGLDARTGAAVFTLEGVVAPFSWPARRQLLYVGDFAGKVSALDLATRTVRLDVPDRDRGNEPAGRDFARRRRRTVLRQYGHSRERILPPGRLPSPVVVNGVVFVGAGDGALYAFHYLVVPSDPTDNGVRHKDIIFIAGLISTIS